MFKEIITCLSPKTDSTLSKVLSNVGGGLYKRIDENRELLELLQDKAPMLLDECPWIVGWIQSNDDVFMALEPHLSHPQFSKRAGFPRPWPVQIEKPAAST